jgi:hypothetical protein
MLSDLGLQLSVVSRPCRFRNDCYPKLGLIVCAVFICMSHHVVSALISVHTYRSANKEQTYSIVLITHSVCVLTVLCLVHWVGRFHPLYGPRRSLDLETRSEGSASRTGPVKPPGATRYPLYRRLGGPQGRSGQVRKISLPPVVDPRTVQPVASRYTDWATGPTHALSEAEICFIAVKYSAFGKSLCTYTGYWKCCTSVYTGLNPFNFISKRFLQNCVREVAVHLIYCWYSFPLEAEWTPVS